MTRSSLWERARTAKPASARLLVKERADVFLVKFVFCRSLVVRCTLLDRSQMSRFRPFERQRDVAFRFGLICPTAPDRFSDRPFPVFA